MAETTIVPYKIFPRPSLSMQPLRTKCCCCIPLRLGCFVLGYLNLIANAQMTLFFVAFTVIFGINTHGFHHLDERQRHHHSTNQTANHINEHVILAGIGIFLGVVIFFNVVWLVVNLACLIGLHTKRPGPIRFYISIASIRHMLVLAYFIHRLIKFSPPSHYIITQSIELGIAAYFTNIYYIHANELEKEANDKKEIERIAQAAVNGSVLIYPDTLDKQQLVA